MFDKKRSVPKEISSEVEVSVVKMIVITRDDCMYQCIKIADFKVKGSPFITLCLGSIELDRVISEPCYKGIIL